MDGIQVQLLILAEQHHQGTPPLLQRDGDGTSSQALTQLRHPHLYGLRGILQFPSLGLLRTPETQTPKMFFVGPVDTYEGSEFGFRLASLCKLFFFVHALILSL